MEFNLQFAIIDLLITVLIMIFATRLVLSRVELPILLIAIALMQIVSLIPVFGWLIGASLFCVLIVRNSDAELMDCIWVLLFAKLIPHGTYLMLYYGNLGDLKFV